jgi:hypothetical protein
MCGAAPKRCDSRLISRSISPGAKYAGSMYRDMYAVALSSEWRMELTDLNSPTLPFSILRR